jgi:hypothetical protein
MLFVARFILPSMLLYIRQSIAEYYICLCVPILVSMAGLLTSYQYNSCKTFPLMGQEEIGSHPFLAIILSSKSNVVILSFINPLCIECVCVVS